MMMELDDSDSEDDLGIEMGTLAKGGHVVPDEDENHASHEVLSVDGVWARIGEWGLFHQSALFVIFLAYGLFAASRVMVSVYIHRELVIADCAAENRCGVWPLTSYRA